MSWCICLFVFWCLCVSLSPSATHLIIEAKVNNRINTNSSLGEQGGDGQDVEGGGGCWCVATNLSY